MSILCLAACNASLAPRHFASVEIQDNGETVVLKSDTLSKHNCALSVNGNVCFKEALSNESRLSILNVLKSSKEFVKDIALQAVHNDGKIEIRLQIDELVDTSFVYRLSSENVIKENASFSGMGATLYNSSSNPNDEVELKKWLFKKKEYMSDSLVHKLASYYRTLTKSGYDLYRVQGSIPVAKSVEGTTYKVNSTMSADYYALVACSNQQYIDDYVENIVGNGFKGLATTLSQQLICHQKSGASGYKCLMLIGINSDWSYTQQPIGVIALDNSAPHNDSYYCSDNDVKHIDFKNGMRIILPANKPKVFGNAFVQAVHWDGNGLECNVTFRVSFSGDVKSVAIQRRGDLCYREYGGGYYFKQEDKMIYAAQHSSPYTFTYKMHFDDGDNIIPVIYEDYHGNKSKSEVRIRASFVRNSAPDINIDNNIDIYN